MCVGDKENFQYKELSGAHSLHYNLTVRFQGGSVQSRSFAEGYWDHHLFLQYDSENQGSAEPRGPWAEKPLGTESWNTEMQDLAEHIKNLKVTLADINAWQEQKGGSHSLQETRGCKIQEDNRTRGFWNFHYDGEPFLSYHPETRSWKVQPSSAQNLAMEVKNSWDADGMQSKDYWAHVHGELCGRLRRYLVSWKGSSHSSGASAKGTLLSPAVNVTCDEASEDTIHVTCWALGFYPQDISVTWHQDGEPLSQDTQWSGGVLPYGNGTYQTWVSTSIPQGQEQRFSCHVGHSRNTSTGSVSCGEPGGPSRGSQPGTALLFSILWIIFLCVAAGAVPLAVILACVFCYKKRRTTSAVECSDLLSLQVWNQQQRAPRNHTGPKWLGYQPLLRAP
ncbi:MHC class I polypeptide-related sequence B-like isoform X2 [Sciurus carolinensis]|uniref:MHC class I polypeptide-related sequence B-like isoform X2 n=1 Tax=Sciurus carolinensis TaxID=30640 RepID=UPI001FB2DFC8|nr:MHC class I polypeptide-related sequence B-like isoform X2 [Sciurus carolinensis]XP_047415608.1 MHC class I polypeptide-related sequence B-like isoform X2 [Sciurus carolinensis]XP_047415609.1 MHC class I polypeptide-related sequence B-like isoform X2 [Sciurus carolinensis]